ncbi:uncharacterized protein (DUF2336 family) [Rhodobium orientis]|uniref:DUF2336 domain-containing protein n=1 Tax=Rhodobium orientis TaxID=34017 RepID=A0A327JPZ8_9HYPH|nr:DUF2336 domain-containing protein [Rhodobium orientis]MBB4301680.1 uncharacterized protein (DUF2336 family) [Rhodobium orientis]MBK5952374.1 hypothetical protein [Rhodobium orientis]RAI28131.1 hypothetical protein CH339_07220 [Rhodobium orientis]
MVVRAFLHWMQTAPVEQRVAAASALARAWLQSELKGAEREDAEAALSVLLDDPAPRVRAAMAEHLAPSLDAPRQVVLGLANDLPDIAETVLRQSAVLLDAELCDLIATNEVRYQVAIASRPHLSQPVSSAIANAGEAAACVALVENDGADLSAAAMRRIADRFGDEPAVREALLARPDLPVPTRQVLIARLGSVLGGFVTERSWMRRERADRIVREACDKATVELVMGTGEGELRPLAEHLRDSGQLTAALLLRMVCSGNMAFFETALSVLSGVRAARVASLIAEGRVSGLSALYQKAGLPKAAFPAFSIALDVFREMDFDGERGDIHRFSQTMINRILDESSRFAPNQSDHLIVLLRRFSSEAARDAARDFLATTIAA